MMWKRPFCAMASLDSFFAPPPSVRGMKALERAAFRREVALPAVRLQPSLCSEFLQRFRPVTLKYPGIKKLVDAKTVEGGRVSGGWDGLKLVCPLYWVLALPVCFPDSL